MCSVLRLGDLQKEVLVQKGRQQMGDLAFFSQELAILTSSMKQVV